MADELKLSDLHLSEEPVASTSKGDASEISYRTYEEGDMAAICALVDSEVRSIASSCQTHAAVGALHHLRRAWKPGHGSLRCQYRYFLQTWPHLCYLALDSAPSRDPIGVIICKQDVHRGRRMRGYIGMLSIRPDRRKRGIATKLVELAVARMQADGAEEVVLETEVDNVASLSLYERLGFMRWKRLHRFYFNAKDAFRLVLPLEPILRLVRAETDSLYT